ncbi:hypothetical protein [Faecalispora jeddahensis]|uniref:hypothetical protein n=1 Tax=Faecalispora jeddahensis TaxID=1414721 RepID=UPI0027B9667F|nr:hypothetical protein [Faecalispora jeddahensis]
MAKHKKKLAKRSGRSLADKYTAHINMSLFGESKEAASAFYGMETDSYRMGNEDKEHGRKVKLLSEFASDFNELLLPLPLKSSIIRANYAVYVDGYNGTEFQSRTICKWG